MNRALDAVVPTVQGARTDVDGPLLHILATARAKPIGGDEDDRPYREFLNALAVAVYTTDADGRITFFNEAAASFWGRRPELGELWCGSFRLFYLDGAPMTHDQCPMAVALKERRPVHGHEAVAERPDGTRVAFLPYPTPLWDDEGNLTGAINVLVDVTERR